MQRMHAQYPLKSGLLTAKTAVKQHIFEGLE